MKGHPGGLEHSRYLMELSFLPPGSRVADLGAGDGSTLRLLEQLGYRALGIDLEPRGPGVLQGDLLHTPWEAGSFDGLISQCSFYVTGDVPGALAEAARLLRKGGKLVFSDLCADVVQLLGQLRQAGMAVRHIEDMTGQWKDYYIEALWKDETGCVPTGKGLSYVLMICERR